MAADITNSPVHWVEGALRASGQTVLPPITVTGARDETEGAIANLLAALEDIGLIVNSTTAS